MMRYNKPKYLIFIGIVSMGIGIWVAEYFSRKIILGIMSLLINELDVVYWSIFTKIVIPYRFILHIILGIQFWIFGVMLAEFFVKNNKSTKNEFRRKNARKIWKVVKTERIHRQYKNA